MKILPSNYCLPKMHKNPVGFRFIIGSPKCSLKPLTKDITAIFKMFYNIGERYHLKGRLWSGIKTFWVIQNNRPVINSINKIDKRNSAKSLATFDFSTLYTKIPHNKLLDVLNEIVDFVLKVELEKGSLCIIQMYTGQKITQQWQELCTQKLLLNLPLNIYWRIASFKLVT